MALVGSQASAGVIEIIEAPAIAAANKLALRFMRCICFSLFAFFVQYRSLCRILEVIKIAIFGVKTVCISYAKHIWMIHLGKPKNHLLYIAGAKTRGSRR
jgi:hypothetical protein